MPTPPGGLQRLQIRNFRNLEKVDLDPAPLLNLVYGANASGKTSLLEAIYTLSRGRSFRSRLFDRVVRKGTDRYSVFARVHGEGRNVNAAIERNREHLRVRIDGADVPNLAPLSALLPVQILHPNSHKLLEDGPQFRRRFLDWGVFHVEPRFLSSWQRYQRALRQRNAALRQRVAVGAWDLELVQAGQALHAMRRAYADALFPIASDIAARLLEGVAVKLEYFPGWANGRDLDETLRRNVETDQERGFTASGPHRADMKVRVDGVSAADRVSRGQQKLLVCALVCAQTLLFQGRTRRRAVLLVDDLPAELDRERRGRLVAQLEATGAQVFVSAIEPELVGFRGPFHRFHVERGVVREVV